MRIAESRFIKAPDDYTYAIRIGSSKIPDILPNGTLLTFKREDITEDKLFMPEELGGLKQEVITRSTAEEMDIFLILIQNTELAIGRRITADLRSYQVEIECSQIPDILPDGTILTFIREDIPVDELFMPEELGE